VTFRHFEEAFFNLWFRIKTDEYGMELPFPFPFRIRPGEMTLFSGDNGSGKSSFLCQAAITLALQGAKPCIASMEVAGEVTAWIMSRQLLGRGHLDDTPANLKLLDELLRGKGYKVRLFPRGHWHSKRQRRNRPT
jgi:energy-coupling factor transporter ATP-binding protein EcfA2